MKGRRGRAWGVALVAIWGCGPAASAPPPVAPEPEPAVEAPPPPSEACRAFAADTSGARPGTIDLRTTGPTAVGGRGRQTVRTALDGAAPRLRYCRSVAERAGADPSGGIAVRFTIVPGGEVCAAEVIANPSRSDAYGECVLAVIRRLAFPAAGSAVEVIHAVQDAGVE